MEASGQTNDRNAEAAMSQGLRKMWLGLKSDSMHLNLSSDKQVYGVVVDIELNGGYVTLATLLTGEASIYFSTGGGYIGGGNQHESINKAAKQLVATAQSFQDKAKLITATPFPDKGNISFYLMTNSGLYAAQTEMKPVVDGHSDWSPLFVAADNVLSAYRIEEIEKTK